MHTLHPRVQLLPDDCGTPPGLRLVFFLVLLAAVRGPVLCCVEQMFLSITQRAQCRPVELTCTPLHVLYQCNRIVTKLDSTFRWCCATPSCVLYLQRLRQLVLGINAMAVC